jgi:hypothetical protein
VVAAAVLLAEGAFTVLLLAPWPRGPRAAARATS